MQVEYGLEPVVSPAAAQRRGRDLRDVELVRAASAVHHPPLDHDTQVLHTSPGCTLAPDVSQGARRRDRRSSGSVRRMATTRTIISWA